MSADNLCLCGHPHREHSPRDDEILLRHDACYHRLDRLAEDQTDRLAEDQTRGIPGYDGPKWCPCGTFRPVDETAPDCYPAGDGDDRGDDTPPITGVSPAASANEAQCTICDHADSTGHVPPRHWCDDARSPTERAVARAIDDAWDASCAAGEGHGDQRSPGQVAVDRLLVYAVDGEDRGFGAGLLLALLNEGGE